MTIKKEEVENYIVSKWGSVYSFLHKEPTFIERKEKSITDELNVYRAELLREKFNRRLKKAGKIWLKNSKSWYSKETIIRDGYMRVDNLFDEPTHRRIKFETMEYLLKTNAEKIRWEYRKNREEVQQIKGSHFRRLSSELERIISDKVRKIIESQIYIDKNEAIGIGNCLHIHYKDDRDSLFHLDNYGAPTVKWFYFPFGCKDCDNGFSYCRGSNTIDEFNRRYIRRISPYTNTSDYIQERIDPRNIYKIGKKVTYFNKENTLIIADTSGFHARAQAKVGTLRVTIQGGLDSRVLANG